MMHPARSLLVSLATLVAAGALSGQTRPPEPPRLAVVISIDQCRADYLQRFWPHFCDAGFRRLWREGAVFVDCHQRHAVTNTAPGHSTILTGVHANVHGIISNEWRDRDTLKRRGAVEDSDYPLVGAVAPTWRTPGGVLEGDTGRSPRRLLAATVGDQLKLRHLQRSRVVAISIKDRQSILLGGRLADAAYWMERGVFVSSRYYMQALPDWAESFNKERAVESWFGKTWDRALPVEAYDALQGPDDAPGEESRLGLGTTFPRTLNGGETQLGKKFYEAMALTPYVANVTLEFAKRAVVAEKLGADETPDLLCLGFPQIDYAGHSYGPDSHEIMDLMIRLDGVLGELFTFLDTTIGAGKYVVALTADHGVTPLPERAALLGKDIGAARFSERELTKTVNSALNTHFKAPAETEGWVWRDSYGYRLVPEVLSAHKADAREAALVVKNALLTAAPILEAYTAEEVLAAEPSDKTVLGRMRLSFHPRLSQDVVFVLKPYVVDRLPAGTNHGSPYDSDDHVPLILSGPGVPKGVRTERVGVDNLAPTLSALLDVPAPPQAAAKRLF